MNGDPLQATKALIRSFGLVAPGAHAVYLQTRYNRETGAAEHVLKVHLNPDHPDAVKVNVPAQFQGFRVEQDDWPTDPNAIYQGP